MECVTPVWITLLSRFELEGVAALHDFATPSNVVGIKCAWLLESVIILENVTAQISELNGSLNIAVDAL